MRLEPSISVDWSGTVVVSQTTPVPSGVGLQIQGEGCDYYRDSVINMSARNTDADRDIGTATSMVSVIRGNGHVRAPVFRE